jgi:uncharacterized phage-associated protein
MSVKFQYDSGKGLAVMGYLASQSIPELSKYKICKLIFLADKYHLVRYGRPITGDCYFALEHGPIPSAILERLEALESGTDKELMHYFDLNRNYTYPRLSAKDKFDLSALSDSDVDALRRTVGLFGQKSFLELRSITHEMPAYKKAWDHRGEKKRAKMDFEDFFEEDQEAISGAFEDMMENDSLSKHFVSF